MKERSKKYFKPSLYLVGAFLWFLAVYSIYPALANVALGTLEPGCAPGDAGCTVDSPLVTNISTSTNVTMTSYGLSFNTNTLYIDPTNNRIGINTSSPLSALDVYGNIIISTSSGYLSFGSTVGTSGYGIRDNSGTLQFKNDSGSWADISGALWSQSGSNLYYDNKIGIGTSTPSTTLHLLSDANQLTIGYSTTTFSTFHIDDSGTLNIQTTGGDEGVAVSGVFGVEEGILELYGDGSGNYFNIYDYNDDAYYTSLTVGSDGALTVSSTDNATTTFNQPVLLSNATEQLRLAYDNGFNYASFTMNEVGNLTMGNANFIVDNALRVDAGTLYVVADNDTVMMGTQDINDTETRLQVYSKDGNDPLSLLYNASNQTSFGIGIDGALTVSSTNNATTTFNSTVLLNNTTKQLRLGYDESNYLDLEVDDTGLVNVTPVGSNASTFFNSSYVVIDNSTTQFYLANGDPFTSFTVGSDGGLTIASSDSNIATTMSQGLTVEGDLTVDTDLLFADTVNSMIGIGTSTPSALLHIVSTTEQLRLGYSGSTSTSFTVDESGLLTIDSGVSVSSLSTGAIEAIDVVGSGTIQAGGWSPTYLDGDGGDLFVLDDAEFSNNVWLTSSTAGITIGNGVDENVTLLTVDTFSTDAILHWSDADQLWNFTNGVNVESFLSTDSAIVSTDGNGLSVDYIDGSGGDLAVMGDSEFQGDVFVINNKIYGKDPLGASTTAFDFTPVNNQVNYLKFYGSASGDEEAVIEALGDDLNVDIHLAPQGSGAVNVDSKLIVTQLSDDDAGGYLDFFKDTASPATSDTIGSFRWTSLDDGDNDTTYAQMVGKILDPVNGQEDGYLSFQGMSNNSMIEFMSYNGDSNDISFEVPVAFNDMVGIGTAAPSTSLHIVSSSEQLRLSYSGDAYTSFTSNDNGELTIASDISNILHLQSLDSAVNYIQITADATGESPTIFATGTDNNIGLNLETKGTGTINMNNEVSLGMGAQEYFLTTEGNLVLLQADSPGTEAGLMLVTGDGDATDDNNLRIYGTYEDTFTDVEYLELGYNAGDDVYKISTQADGTGVLVGLELFTEGNSNQMYLGTDGLVGIGTSTPSSSLHIVSESDDQLIIAYDSEAYTSFVVDTDGILTITPFGNDPIVEVTGDLDLVDGLLYMTGSDEILTMAVEGSESNYTSFYLGSDGALTVSSTASTTFTNDVVINNLYSGMLSMPQDGGQVDVMDIPVSASADTGSAHGYNFLVDGLPAMSVYGLASAGTVSSVGVSIGTANTSSYSLYVQATNSTTPGIGVDGYIKATGYITETTSTADIAETYPIDSSCVDNNTCPIAGDVVCSAETDAGDFIIERCQESMAENALGVITSDPGFVLGGFDYRKGLTPSTYRVLALSGRVPVRVSNKNGEIKAGDYLTASDIPGIAVKATTPGRVLGVALKSQTSPTGTVQMFINVHWNPGNINFVSNELPEQYGLLDRFTMAIKNSLRQLGLVIEKGIAKVKELRTDKLCVGNTCIDENQLQQMLINNNTTGSTPTQMDNSSSSNESSNSDQNNSNNNSVNQSTNSANEEDNNSESTETEGTIGGSSEESSQSGSEEETGSEQESTEPASQDNTIGESNESELTTTENTSNESNSQDNTGDQQSSVTDGASQSSGESASESETPAVVETPAVESTPATNNE